MRLWGFTRPQTVSVFGAQPSAAYEPLIFRHPSLDFGTTHIYSEGAIDYPHDTISPAVAMAYWVRHGLARVPAGRPFTDTEHGPIRMFNDHERMLDEGFDDEYERHMMWAHLASGGAGSGMRWPARHPHVITQGMQRALRALARFAELIDWRDFAPLDANEAVSTEACGVIPFACRDEQQAVIWLLRDKPPHQPNGVLPEREPLRDLSLRLHGLAPGPYTVHLWDTLKGESQGRLHSDVDAADGALPVVLPSLGNDLALAVHPRRSGP